MKSFDEVVNQDFFQKYGDKINEKFNLFDRWNGKVDMKKMIDIFNSMDGGRKPNRFIYYLIHGEVAGSFMLPDKYSKDQEEMYKKCLEQGITWKKLTNFKDNKDVLY